MLMGDMTVFAQLTQVSAAIAERSDIDRDPSLLRTFYKRERKDESLGSIFAMSAALMSGLYQGQPMERH